MIPKVPQNGLHTHKKKNVFLVFKNEAYFSLNMFVNGGCL